MALRTQLREDNYQDYSIPPVKLQDGIYDFRGKYFDYFPFFYKTDGIYCTNDYPESLTFDITGARELTVKTGSAALNGVYRDFVETTCDLTTTSANMVATISADFSSSGDIIATIEEYTGTFSEVASSSMILGYVLIPNTVDALSLLDLVEFRNKYSPSAKLANITGTLTTSLSGVRVPLPSYGTETVLNGAIDDSITTITVLSTDGFPVKGIIKIGAEYISYTSKTKIEFLGCTRGEEYSTSAAHLHEDSIDYSANPSDCDYHVSINYIDGYPIWEWNKWYCAVNSTTRITDCWASCATWGGVTVYGSVNYHITAIEGVSS